MSNNDYIEKLRNSNPVSLGVNYVHDKILMTPAEFEKQIRLAFEAGSKEGKDSKSIFEQMFGK